MARSDRYSALFILALAIYICWESMEIGMGTLGQPGPALMSFGAGAGMGLLALVCLIQAFRLGRHPGLPAEAGTSRKGTVIAISVSLFVYAMAVTFLGFILATLLFLFFLFRVVESEPWWRSAVKAILVTAGNYLLFVVWLGVNLPKGILPW
ncbi:MAG: tripartite tricarboxylate transporter TctB family protein [Syntrophaceae bacterium]|nr:tripartite tricarboxylate transporter TctB family protein [Syntrophaceae bacterium]